MAARDEVLQQARSRGARALTEFEAKCFLADYGFPFPPEKTVASFDQLASTARVPLKEMLVQQMVAGDRELMAGLVRDPQFGPCVLFGLGGIYTEALEDVAFRVAPLSRWDARQMMDELRGGKLLDAFRGMPPVDRGALADILITLGTIGLENPAIREIDINPLKIRADGQPIAVDALIILG